MSRAFSGTTSTTALADELKVLRFEWGEVMLAKKHQARWYFNHIIWMGPCNCIAPGSPKSIEDLQIAGRGKSKRWISDDAKDDSRNLRPSPQAGKQCRWGDKRVWWFMVLTQGKLHIEVMGDGWRQNGIGMATMVNRLPRVLGRMLKDSDAARPSILSTDRGPGLYHPSQGSITPEYAEACEANGFETWAGDHATWQPPDIPDMLLHETAISWVRKYLRYNPVKFTNDKVTNWELVVESLKDAARYANTYHEARDLCMHFPTRLKTLVEKEGERCKW